VYLRLLPYLLAQQRRCSRQALEATSERTVYNIIATRRDAGTKANSSAIDTLNSTVKTQGDTLSSIGSRTTSLENSLKTTNDNVSKKADSTALQTLQNTVTQQGKDITSSSSAITSLQNGLVAANSNIDKKADATALQSLQNTVEQRQGSDHAKWGADQPAEQPEHDKCRAGESGGERGHRVNTAGRAKRPGYSQQY
jgi:hypothetical protein